MSEAWRRIWNARDWPADRVPTLADLIALDGFDTASLAVLEQDWRHNAQGVRQQMDIRPGESVYEVGCGAGAFLAALRQVCPIAVGGLDFSSVLIRIARMALPEGQFDVADAVDLPVQAPSDHVVAHSVFQYLPQDVAEQVIGRMWRKARRGIALLDLPDLATRSESEALRRANLPPGEYDTRYAGLAHTYYGRSDLQGLITRLAPQARVTITQSHMALNPQSAFRFNLYASTVD